MTDYEVHDDTDPDDPEAARLRHVRSQRTALSRGAVRRGRDWSFIGAIVLFAVALQLIFLAAGNFTGGSDAAGVVMCGLTIMAFAASYILFRRGRRLAAAAREL